MKKLNLFGMLAAALFALSLPLCVYANDNGAVSGQPIKRIKKGHNYLGGYCPWLDKMQIVDEVYSGGKYRYLQKAIIKRASGDVNKNGRFTIFNASTYYQAFKKLNKKKRRLIETLGGIETVFRITKTTPFPPVQFQYNYTVFVFDLNGSMVTHSPPAQYETKRGRMLIKALPKALQPGKYKVSVGSWVEMLPHPIEKVLDIWDVIDTAISLASGDIAGALGLSESIPERILKQVIKRRVLETSEDYYLNVPAKLPQLKGQRWDTARNALLARSLGYKLVTTTKCSPANYNQVISQSHAGNKFYLAGTEVTLNICKALAAPTPTPNTGSQVYGVYTVPCPYSYSNLFVGTAAQLSNKSYSSFSKCGNNTAKITNFTKIAGASSQSTAEQALCGGISGYGYFSGAKYYLWGASTRYWGGDPSVQTAMTHYCPGKR